MHTGDIAETNLEDGKFNIFGHAMSSTFDLLISKPNQFTFVPRCTSDESLEKIYQ